MLGEELLAVLGQGNLQTPAHADQGFEDLLLRQLRVGLGFEDLNLDSPELG